MTLTISLICDGVIHQSSDLRILAGSRITSESCAKQVIINDFGWRAAISFAGIAERDGFNALQLLIPAIHYATPFTPRSVLQSIKSYATVALKASGIKEPLTYSVGLMDGETPSISLISNIDTVNASGQVYHSKRVRNSMRVSTTRKRWCAVLAGSCASAFAADTFSEPILKRHSIKDPEDAGKQTRRLLATIHRETAQTHSDIGAASMVQSLFVNASQGDLHGHVDGMFLPLVFQGKYIQQGLVAAKTVRHCEGSQMAATGSFYGGYAGKTGRGYVLPSAIILGDYA